MTMQLPGQEQGMPLPWAVNHIEETFGPAGIGQINRVMRVWLDIMGQPNVTYVDIPFDHFTTTYVAAQAEQHAAQWIEASTLKSAGF